METTFKPTWAFYAITATVFAFTSCSKEDSASQDGDTNSPSVIAVAATLSNNTSDSIYMIGACGSRERRASITQADLPGAVSTYITANYSGATFHKAFVTKDSEGAVTGYVVIVYVNDKPVGLKFDAAGTFVKVLEQRERGDMRNHGFHHGGRFEHRDGQQRDTIALSALPASVLVYFAANYSTDTLVKAFKNRDGSIVVLSRNNGAFATLFDAAGTFAKRAELASRRGQCQPVDQTAIPLNALSYLTATYPAYTFKKAFVIREAGMIKGYVVVIDANNTKYAVEFDATGNFVKVKVIH